MIDIETLSTEPHAVILTIGAIKFNRLEPIQTLEKCNKFYIRVDKQSCVNYGLHIDPKTVEWWSKQNKETKYDTLEHTDRHDLNIALTKLSDFLKGHRYIWANSPSFDCIILENAYQVCGLEVPWKFWNLRDCRTINDIAKLNLKTFSNGEISHNALQDCYNQILCLQNGFQKLNIP